MGIFTQGYEPHPYDEWLLTTVSSILDDELHIGSRRSRYRTLNTASGSLVMAGTRDPICCRTRPIGVANRWAQIRVLCTRPPQ